MMLPVISRVRKGHPQVIKAASQTVIKTKISFHPQLPNSGPVLDISTANPLMESENFRCFCTPGRIHQMLIMCLFSLSAILASVLITIYILQHLHWEKNPP